MRAKESVENYDSRIREYANYSFRQSRNICKTIGERQSGSENEQKLLEHIASELNTCADEVKTQEFKFAADYKILQNKVGAVSFILAAAVLLFTMLTGLASLLGIVASAVCLAGIILGFSGKCYAPKKLTSKNVYGIKKCLGEAKERIILVGNADCMRSTKMAGRGLKVFSVISGIIFMIIGIVLFLQGNNTVKILPDEYVGYLSIPVCVFLVFDVLVLFGKYDGVSDGANKNLSGAFTSVAVLKYLKDMDISLNSTEVAVLITGAHEADLSGAKSFVKTNPEQMKDVPTCVLCLDCLREENDLAIKFVNDGSFAKNVSEYSKVAGNEINIKSMKYKTDSDVFSKCGISSCTITAVPENCQKLEDTYEDMKIKTIETALKTAMETVFSLDEN